jgi:D-alanyl-D-alanine carboxypeptidase
MKEFALNCALDFINDWLKLRASQVDIPGFTVSIHHGDDEIFSHAYGYADVALGNTMSTGHLFSMGSQSKMITSAAILQIIASEKIDLDTPITEYIPWVLQNPDIRYHNLTVRHLLCHTGGLIRDGDSCDYWLGTKAYPDSRELRRIVELEPLFFDPYSQMKYSNVGFALLGQIIEKISDQSYSSYVRNKIQEAVSLDNFYPDWQTGYRARLATGYSIPTGHERQAVEIKKPFNTLAPATGCIATATAMGQFATKLYQGSLVADNKLVHEAFRSQWKVSEGYDKGYEYGLGFEVMHIGSRRLLGHGGSTPGYRTATFFEPHEKLAVSVCANCKDAAVIAMTCGIFESLFHFIDTASSPASPAIVKLNTRLQNNLAQMQIIATKEAIVAIDPNSWEPFTWAEQLATVNDETLVVSTHNSIHATGEKVIIEHHSLAGTSVKFGGITMRQPATERTTDTTSYTLPEEDAMALFLHHLQQSRKEVFMLEVLPEYDLDMEHDGNGDSLQAWLLGKKQMSMSLLEAISVSTARQPGWLRACPRRSLIRIRILDNDKSPYVQWEKEHFSRINVPLLGERIYYIPRKKVGNLLLPSGDMTICSQGPIMVNRYDNSKHTASTFFNSADCNTERLLYMKKSLLQMVQQGQYSEELK